jgi:hypothetical protein
MVRADIRRDGSYRTGKRNQGLYARKEDCAYPGFKPTLE